MAKDAQAAMRPSVIPILIEKGMSREELMLLVDRLVGEVETYANGPFSAEALRGEITAVQNTVVKR
ncbi:MAG: hypothetical protein WC107_04275 [Patescibacteria group bacterium]